MCDFDDDFSDGFEDDGFSDNESFDESLPGGDDPMQDDTPIEAQPDEPCGPDWEDIALFGSMSESIAEEKRKRDKIKRDMFGDD